MCGILEKLQKVQIKNKSRLSQEDQVFCEKQQELYDKVRNHYLSMFIDMEKLHKQELSFWNELTTERGITVNDVYYQEFIHLDIDKQNEFIIEVHNCFIKNIVLFFNKKYGLEIESSSWERYIHIETPQEPYCPDHYFRLSADEKKAYKEKMSDYQNKCNEYKMQIIYSRIHYDNILDDIFIYLGGFSFQEKVNYVIKEDAKKTLKYANCTVKNKKISFQGLTYTSISFFKKYEINLCSKDYLAVLRALSYYDSDHEDISIYGGWKEKFTTFSSYSKKSEETGIFAEHETHGNKVQRFKYYKNGRWDVIFDTGTHALEFAKEFLDYRKAA